MFSLLENEHIHYFTNKHPILLIGIVLLRSIKILILTGVFVLFIQYIPTFSLDREVIQGIFIGFSAMILFNTHKLFLEVFEYFGRGVVVCDSHVIILHKSLFRENKQDMIDILKIQDIKINQHGIIQAILNYGIVSFILTSGEVSKVARFVPDPYHLVEHIHRIKLQKETG